MPKIVDHEKMRKELLTSSFSHFARGGYRGVSIRQLANELGVTTGTLYHYFKSKEDLFCLMINEFVGQDVAAGVAKMRTSKNPIKKIMLLTDFVIENESYFKNLLFLLIEFFREEDGFVKEKELFKDSLHLYRKTIEKELGLPFQFVGTGILAIFIGLFIQKIVDPKRVSIKNIKDYVCTII